MSVSIFLSYPKPFTKEQEKFLKKMKKYLKNAGYEAKTLGVTNYDLDAPLKGIRRLMLESNGIITIAFKRTLISKGEEKPNTNNNKVIKSQWITSPWAHIEPAMAFQIGLPVMIFREKGVIADGILEQGVLGTYMPEFDLNKSSKNYFNSTEFKQLIKKWELHVGKVIENKGNPKKLF